MKALAFWLRDKAYLVVIGGVGLLAAVGSVLLFRRPDVLDKLQARRQQLRVRRALAEVRAENAARETIDTALSAADAVEQTAQRHLIELDAARRVEQEHDDAKIADKYDTAREASAVRTRRQLDALISDLPARRRPKRRPD